MTRYITLIRYTDKGAQSINQSPARAKAFCKAAAKAGVKVESQFWTLGKWDGVLVISAEQPETALRCLTELAALGNIRTSTMQAFDAGEFEKMV